jgi:hypothetical protein
VIGKFPNLPSDFFWKALSPRGVPENGKLRLASIQQRAQHHCSPLFRNKTRERRAGGIEDKSRETFERKDVQPGVTVEIRAFQKLPFQLEGRLLGREKNERFALRVAGQFISNVTKTPKRFSAAGRPEKKRNVHLSVFIGFARDVQRNVWRAESGTFLAPFVEISNWVTASMSSRRHLFQERGDARKVSGQTRRLLSANPECVRVSKCLPMAAAPGRSRLCSHLPGLRLAGRGCCSSIP